MASVDIESLFAKIPSLQATNLCVQNLFKDRTYVDDLSKYPFRELLARTMYELLILSHQ